jgi:hypothetical protein
VTKKQPAPDRSVMIGIAVRHAHPCRCGCSALRFDYHSVRSKKLIWRCLWCRQRRGAPTEAETEKVAAFCKLYGFVMQPLILHENGHVYVEHQYHDVEHLR